MTYSTREDCAARIRTTWVPRLSGLPESRRSGFIEAVMDEYLKKYPADTDGTIHIIMVRLDVRAKKPQGFRFQFLKKNLKLSVHQPVR